MYIVWGRFTRANRGEVEGDLCVEFAAPDVGRLVFRSHGRVFGVDELRNGHVTIYADPNHDEVKALLDVAKRQGIIIMHVDPITRRMTTL